MVMEKEDSSVLFTKYCREIGLFQSVGVSFDIVLDQDSCEKSTSLEKTHSRQKSLKRHFPVETTLGTIRLVDDDPTKCMSGEKHLFMCIPEWNGNKHDVALFDLLEKVMNENVVVVM
jgi:hypothetical protein